ncbi:MAG: MazG nucleotide pyrophosphohydrolase domain-containing protein [Candidatus Izemoplasma sp.]
MLKTDMTVKELQDHVREIDFHPEHKLEVMLKLVEEVGELAVEVRKESLYGLTDELKKDMKYELYDIIHFVAHIANIYDIDLVDAIIEKDKINQIRYGKRS